MADQIDAADVGINRRGQVDVVHPGLIAVIHQHLRRRHDAGLDDVLLVINIVDKHIERAYALRAACFENAPFIGRNDARNDVKRNHALDVARFAVNREGNAFAVKHRQGLLVERFDIGRIGGGQPGRHRLAARARPAVGQQQFIVKC